MKISAKSLLSTAWVLLTLVLLNAWRTARWEFAHVSQCMAEVHVVDEITRTPVTNFTVRLPPLSTEFRTNWQQHLIVRPENGLFVIAQVGGEPLRATVRSPGYVDAEMDLGSHAFKSEPVIISMKKGPQPEK